MRSLFDFGGYVSVFILVLVFGLMASVDLQAQELPKFEAEIRVEVNDTDGDAGFQLFVDGDPWQRIRVKGPDGRHVYGVSNRGKLRRFGSAELFTESNEPNYADLSLPEILEFMPEGEYEFKGFTIDRQKVETTAELTHDLPCGPEVIFPAEGEEVDPTQPLIIAWMPVTNKIDTSSPTGECGNETDIEIEHYELVIEIVDSEPEQKLTVILPPDTTEYLVSPDFVVPGAEYKFEVLAREESGNQTITESTFFTSD
ncbi:MAG: hypothetical protein DHS20C13_08990 [Thermodesulfobacteriota bacterium]|nr:MAG: hypothetical protein DHS20C13_08990 [Thermodesulfobacteriota bacterium]